MKINRSKDAATGVEVVACCVFMALALAGCSGGGSDPVSADPVAAVEDPPVTPPPPPSPTDPTDIELHELIDVLGMTGDPAIGRDLPSIDEPVAQLGMKLFFSKSLGGGLDAACVSCHHPLLGGGDNLSLSVGTGTIDPDVLGIGRQRADGLPNVPRNAPTIFNSGLRDSGMFWDSRVESLDRAQFLNGAGAGIRTPDTAYLVSDVFAGRNLPTAQSRFPVTSSEEMKTDAFENGSDNNAIRAHLAARIGDYGVGAGELPVNEWLTEFQNAFASALPADQLITFENIAIAIGEYERSMVFTNSPWRAYVNGDFDAISESAKRGALLFLNTEDDDGLGCVQCHSGDFFSDGEHHTIGFPQIGPGKGDGNDDDFGRERETGLADDRYRFRTPSLLNVEVTGPYGHAGAYETLDEVVRHYDNQNGTVNDFFDDGGWCQLPQFDEVANCEALYTQAEDNTDAALAKVNRERRTARRHQFPGNVNGPLCGGRRLSCAMARNPRTGARRSAVERGERVGRSALTENSSGVPVGKRFGRL
ncbi:MAG: cytochrome-c peroxidase [Gammaproteobacteria bacterium]